MERIKVGEFVKTVGLKGELKVYPYAEETSIHEGATLYSEGKTFEVKKMRMQKNMPVITLKGIDHINEAENLVGQEIEMNREDIILEDDEFLIDDLLGIEVFEKEESLGKITDVKTLPGHDIYVINHTLMIPAVEAFVKEINLEEKTMQVELIEGMRDES